MKPCTGPVAAFLDGNTIGGWVNTYRFLDRSGASIVNLTDSPTDVAVDGFTYRAGGNGTIYPVPKFRGRKEEAGFNISNIRIHLQCHAGALWQGVSVPRAAIEHRFDGVEVRAFRVFTSVPGSFLLGETFLFRGRVGPIERVTFDTVELKIESGIANLNTPLPPTEYKPSCGNQLGDANCGVSLASFQVSGSVTGSSSVVSVASSLAQADDYFTLGVITFGALTPSVALRGIRRAVRSYAGGVITVDRPLPQAPAIGDIFVVTPGCNRNATDPNGCPKFYGANAPLHTRAFPNVPRNESAL